MSKRKVVFCEEANTLVVAEWTGAEWLHLHNDTIEEDHAAVVEFEENQPKKWGMA